VHFLGRVDLGCRDLGRFGLVADEPLWRAEERGVKGGLARDVDCVGLSEVNLVGCHQADACVMIPFAGAFVIPHRETNPDTAFPGSEHGLTLELDGALTVIMGLAQNDKSPLGSGPDVRSVVSSVKLVAGAGFEPAAFRL